MLELRRAPKVCCMGMIVSIGLATRMITEDEFTSLVTESHWQDGGNETDFNDSSTKHDVVRGVFIDTSQTVLKRKLEQNIRHVDEGLVGAGAVSLQDVGHSFGSSVLFERGVTGAFGGLHLDLPMLSIGGLVVLVVALCYLASAPKEGRFWSSPFFMMSWMLLSVGTTIFNKWIFMPAGCNFPFAAILAFWHMFSATVLTQVLRFIKPALFPAVDNASLPLRTIFRIFAPLSVLSALVLALGNATYLYLPVSYAQMVKAAMPGMVVLVSACVGLDDVNMLKALMMVVLGLGVFGCARFEMLFSWIGFACQIACFVFDSVRLVVMKLTLDGEGVANVDPMSMLFYMAPMNSFALLLPILLECHEIPWMKLYELRFVFACSALVAFGLNVASVCYMESSSVVTYTICGLIQDVTLIFGSTFIFHNEITREQIISACVVLATAAIFQMIQKTRSKQLK